MGSPSRYSALLLDIGGVLLTNGWDRAARMRAAERFDVDVEEMEERHAMAFGTYEEGKLSLDTYLRRVIFHTERRFSMEDFREFMFAQSKPHPEMIEFLSAVARTNQLRVAAVSNEGRELTEYRIGRFGLGSLIQLFISSCFVHYRKPDEDIYRMALDVAQVPAERAVYIDDRPLFVEVARTLGITGIRHQTLEGTRDELARLGLAPR